MDGGPARMTAGERVLEVETTRDAAIAILFHNLLGDPGIGLLCPECGDWHPVELKNGEGPTVTIGPVCEALHESTLEDETRVLTASDLEEEESGD